MLNILLLLLAVVNAHAKETEYVSEDFPIIDLGYARHAPTKINQTSVRNISYATYSNIRFAQPPLGQLRFKAPQQPPPISEGIRDGVVAFNETNCVQSIPHYFDFLPGLNGSTWGNEDCLFLDVIVPSGVTNVETVPVLHWLYGGGFFYGAKDNGGNPAALFDSMNENENFIIVASNYRLGAFGWLASEEESVAPNAGLYDALAALEWTRDNIHRFGGDNTQVTVMGQSAGGGIIAHLLAASAQGVIMPFSQAILSSPGYRPHVNRSQETQDIYNAVLKLTNCSSIDCLRSVDEKALVDANRHILLLPEEETSGFPGLSISFGPLLDNELVQELPEVVFAAHAQNPKPVPNTIKRIIAGSMENDGAASTIGTFASWKDMLSIFARNPSPSTVAKIESLYGPFNASASSFLPDGSVFATPADQFAGDIIYACHSQLAARAYSGGWWPGLASESYRYELSIQPALHGGDLSYYFFDPVIAAVDPTVSSEIARTMQQYFRDFVRGKEMRGWPEYGGFNVGDFNIGDFNVGEPSWMNITGEGFQAAVGESEARRYERCMDIVQLLSRAEDGW